MATQTVEFRAPAGQTVVAKLFAVGSDTEVASVTATEATNRKGTYAAAYTDVDAATYDLIALVGGVPVARWQVTLNLATATFYAYEPAQVSAMAANTLTASAIAASAMNGKGDWNIGKTGYSLTATTGLGNQTANITGNLSGTVGGIAGTTTTLDALQTALNSAHGSGSWATATGFSTHSAADVWAVGTRTITGGSLTTAPPTAGAIADAVWDEARTGHTTNGTFGYYLDAAISGVSSPVSIDAAGAQLIVNSMMAQGPTLYNALATSETTLIIGDEYVQEFTGLGDLTARSNIAFVLKTKKSDTDNAALIYLTETGGLTRLNGAAYATTGNGTITVDDANVGDITVRISSAVTANLTVGKRQDAVKILIASGNDTTPRQGITNVIDGTVDARG